MRLTFLGTGASTAYGRFNCSVAVDGRVLLDAGAPLISNLPRAGIAPEDVRCLLLTHCHGDHFVGAGTFLLDRVFRGGPGLVIAGPSGSDSQVDALCRILWGEEWRNSGPGGFDLEYVCIAAGAKVEFAGYRIEVVEIKHDDGYYHATPSVGYILDDGETRLGYSGDAAEGPWVDRLLDRCDAAIVECSGQAPGPTHLSDAYVRDLVTRHPRARVILTHFWSDTPTIDGATVARDMTVVELDRRSRAPKLYPATPASTDHPGHAA